MISSIITPILQTPELSDLISCNYSGEQYNESLSFAHKSIKTSPFLLDFIIKLAGVRSHLQASKFFYSV